MANHVCEKSMNSSMVFCIYFVQQKDAILNTSRNLGWKLKNLFSLNQEKTKWALVNEKSQQKFPWNHFSQNFFREIDFTEKRIFFVVFDTMCHFSSYALLRIDKSQIKFGRKCIIKSCKLLYANDWINHSAKMNWILIFFRKKHSRTIFKRLFLLLTYLFNSNFNLFEQLINLPYYICI